MVFRELNIIEPILRALEKKGYVEPTPIQKKTIPLLLDNQDVIGIAQTGTGKTAAFVVPILQKLHERINNVKSTTPKALILAPTRELAVQISESFKAYGTFLSLKCSTVYGGVGIMPQIRELQRGIDILIATPGRLLDLMNQGRVNLKEIEFFVLDEADRMLDMGFLKDIKKIVLELPEDKQSLFFSATMSDEIAKLTRKFLRDPVRMEITPQSTPVEKIKQAVFFIDSENKIDLLLDLIGQQKMNCILIFVKTKHKADKVARMLSQNHIRADSIHGNKSQVQRMQALGDFKTGKIRALVATDIAARGIDVNNISHVINFDLPNEPENYVHRIGRTARAGSEGTAYSFCSAEERDYLNQIEKITKTKTHHTEHKYHSAKAKNAVGKDAKPKPRGQGYLGRGKGVQRNNLGGRYNKKSKGSRKGVGGNRFNKTNNYKRHSNFKNNSGEVGGNQGCGEGGRYEKANKGGGDNGGGVGGSDGRNNRSGRDNGGGERDNQLSRGRSNRFSRDNRSSRVSSRG